MTRYASAAIYDSSHPKLTFPHDPGDNWVAITIDAIDYDGSVDIIVDFLPDGIGSDLPPDTVGNIIACQQVGRGGFVEILAEGVTRQAARDLRRVKRSVGDATLQDYKEWLRKS